MISRDTLAPTMGAAPGIAVYGGPGMKKTHAIHTLPPPVLDFDIGEGGFHSIAPWVRRVRNADERNWLVYTDEDRQQFFNLLEPGVKKNVKYSPRPYVDIIHFDNTSHEHFNLFTEQIGAFNTREYNSLALDSLQEFSGLTQTYSKGPGNFMRLMNEVTHAWIRAQEYAQQRLRKLRDYRAAGVFIYMTGAEDIAKDYVQSPLEKRQPGQQAPEAYSIRGTVEMPGKLASALAHLPDVLCHARLVNGQPIWITKPESLPGGGASWDAKDRFGRLPEYIQPDIREMCKYLYGVEGMKTLYAEAVADTVHVNAE